MTRQEEAAAYREHARRVLATDELEFNPSAAVSIPAGGDGDDGAFVAAWVWVPRSDVYALKRPA